MSLLEQYNLGCILLGLFWLFLFQFRNNNTRNFNFEKNAPCVSDLETESEVT